MRGSKTGFLFICVLLVGGYIWFVERNRLSPAEQKAVDRQAFDLSMDRVDRIGIRTADLEVEMVSEGARWMLSEPEGARASEPVVNQLLARFRSLSRGEFITPADMRSRSLTLADFGLEVPQMMLTLGIEDQRRVYAIGSPNPLGTALYVKEESSQNVMLVSSDLLEILPPDVSFFRDPELFPITPSEVRELALVTQENTVRLKRESGEWWIQNPVRARADSGKVEDLLTKLGQSRIEGVSNRPGPEVVEAFSASGDPVSIRLWSNAQTVPVEVEVGGTVPGNTQLCYARIAGQGGYIEVSKGLQVLAKTSAAALRDRSVLTMTPEAIHTLRISERGAELVLVRKDKDWQLQKPLNLPASSARVQQVIGQWNEALVEAFLPSEPASDPSAVLGSVTFEGGKKGESVTYGLLQSSPLPGRALVRRSKTGEVLQLVPDVVKYLPRDPYAYVSRRLLSFDTDRAVRISLEKGDSIHTVTRGNPDTPWASRREGWQVDQESMESMLEFLSGLYAESVISFRPDISTNPEARLSIGLGGETPENLTLVISDSMIWVQGREVIYAVSAARLSELLEALPRALSEAEDSLHATEKRP